MEYVLHRVNTPERLQMAIDSGVDRVEVDLRWRRGTPLVTHDPPVGPWAIGPNGVQFSRWPVPMPHWQGRFLDLDALLDLEPPPLLLDLKGPWTETAFDTVARSLAARRRSGDLIASNRWSLLDRCRMQDEPMRFVYGLPRRAVTLALERFRAGDRPFAVSIRPGLAGQTALIDRLRDDGIAVYVWDLTRREQLRAMERVGVAGAIFDDASWMSRDGGI